MKNCAAKIQQLYKWSMTISLIIVVILQFTLYDINKVYIDRARILVNEIPAEENSSKYIDKYIKVAEKGPASIFFLNRDIVIGLETADIAVSISEKLRAFESSTETYSLDKRIRSRNNFLDHISGYRLAKQDIMLGNSFNSILLFDIGLLENNEKAKEELEAEIDSTMEELNNILNTNTIMCLISIVINTLAVNKVFSMLRKYLILIIKKIRST